MDGEVEIEDKFSVWNENGDEDEDGLLFDDFINGIDPMEIFEISPEREYRILKGEYLKIIKAYCKYVEKNF